MGVDTWHISHPYDKERFFKALHQMIREPNFNPDEMGEYMRRKACVSRDDDDNVYNQAIDDYVTAAWTLKDYLKANGL